MSEERYECHITVEPVEGFRLERLKEICTKWKFRVSTLLMQKSLEKSNLDSFCTGKDTSLFYMKHRMLYMIQDLKKENFNIHRYKIEKIVFDSKLGDII